jgi:hypothetical protein
MSFNYKAYLKNNPLLEELPKGQWIDLDKQETEEYAGDIFVCGLYEDAAKFSTQLYQRLPIPSRH